MTKPKVSDSSKLKCSENCATVGNSNVPDMEKTCCLHRCYIIEENIFVDGKINKTALALAMLDFDDNSSLLKAVEESVEKCQIFGMSSVLLVCSFNQKLLSGFFQLKLSPLTKSNATFLRIFGGPCDVLRGLI